MSKINTPYKLLDTEKKLVVNNFSVKEDWEKGIFNQVKLNIKNDLRPKQSNICCYCKRELSFEPKSVDIEHIIPKDLYAKFTFEPLNLALSCPTCNTNKGTKNVLYNETIVRYPRTGKNFRIVHAHYDTYDDHIEIIQGCVFSALSNKGAETIRICKLWHLKTTIARAQDYIASTTDIGDIVEQIRTTEKGNLKHLLDALTDRLKNEI